MCPLKVDFFLSIIIDKVYVSRCGLVLLSLCTTNSMPLPGLLEPARG